MLSTFPATSMSLDSIFSSPFPDFEGGFTPWGSPEAAFNLQPPAVLSPIPAPASQELAISNSGSDESVKTNSGSEEPTRKRSIVSNNSGSEIDERKRRRMISNRESARRSRMRKQKHLENLRNQANRQRLLNRELINRVRSATLQCQVVETENERLQAESSVLRQRLWELNQVLLLRQLQQQLSSPAWPHNYNYVVEQQRLQSSLITR